MFFIIFLCYTGWLVKGFVKGMDAIDNVFSFSFLCYTRWLVTRK
jgi:hypothetical protein